MITIALSKGRIEANFYKILLDKNITKNIINPNRSLKINVDDNIELLLVKPVDVIKLVSCKYANVGIVGSDSIEEENDKNIVELLDLDIGKCSFALSTIPGVKIEDIKSIATKYPNIAKRLINDLGINSNIVKMEGSLEVAPIINYADAIVDLVETGNTLKANGLIILKRLLEISTRVITNEDSIDDYEVKRFIKRMES